MSVQKILVVTTGGTILSVYDAQRGSIAPGVTGSELLAPILHSVKGVELDVRDFVQKPGPHLTPDIAFQLADELQRMEEEYDGFVVIQGTDTIEEFSYLLSLVSSPAKPIVFTGAMKSNNEYYADGLGNVTSAIRVVCSEQSRGRGVMVVFNENIFSPETIIKMHATNIDSFQSPDTGPLGSVVQGEVYFYHDKKRAKTLQKCYEPMVELLKVTMGSNAFLLDRCLEAGIKGIVIEGFGAGNVPPGWVSSIEKAIQTGIPVVITTRCPRGSSVPLYDYLGGGKSLESVGAIFAKHLSGPKARIKLMLLLGQSPRLSMEDIRAAFCAE